MRCATAALLAAGLACQLFATCGGRRNSPAIHGEYALHSEEAAEGPAALAEDAASFALMQEQRPAAAQEIGKSLISQIFVMCVVMYGGIAILWGINLKAGAPETYKAALLCLSWSTMSVGMHVLNKALVGYLEAPSVISAVQMMTTVLVVGPKAWTDLRDAPRDQLLRWMVVPVFFAGMLISSFYAYEHVSLTLLTLVRNLTPLFMLPLEALVMPSAMRPAITAPVGGGILVMLVGAGVYSGGNLDSISVLGVSFIFLNMFLAVSDRLIQRRLLTTECKDLSTGACALITNACGLIPTLFIAVSTGEFHEASAPGQRARWGELHVLVLLILSGLVGTGICVLGFECQRIISATSFVVMQNVSKVAVVGAGIVFFADPVHSVLSVLGLGVSLGGSFLYSWAQLQAAYAAKAAKQSEAPAAAAAVNAVPFPKEEAVEQAPCADKVG